MEVWTCTHIQPSFLDQDSGDKNIAQSTWHPSCPEEMKIAEKEQELKERMKLLNEDKVRLEEKERGLEEKERALKEPSGSIW